MSLYLLGASYLAMALAGFLIQLIFQALGIVPAHFHVSVFESRPTWNYTTFLDLAALGLVAVLGWRFLKTSGLEMLRMMSHGPSDSAAASQHHHV